MITAALLGVLSAARRRNAANGYLTPFYPTVCYSMRKRNSAYAGQCIRVRRSSDDAEQDIGFDFDGWCDSTAAVSFVGSGTGFVTVWYDQSGLGVDLSMATTSRQPTIINSGAVEVLDGKMVIKFSDSGTADSMTAAATSAFGFGTGAWAFEQYAVYDGASFADKAIADFRSGGGQNGILDVTTGGVLYYFNGTVFGNTGTGITIGTASWNAYTYAGGTGGLLKGFVAGNQEWSTAATLNFGATRPLTLCSDFAFGAPWRGRVAEVLITNGTQVLSGNYTPRSYLADS